MRRDFLTEIGFICAIFLLGCGWVAVQISAYRSQHTATSTCRVLDIQMSQIESSNSSHPPLSRISIFTDQPPHYQIESPQTGEPLRLRLQQGEITPELTQRLALLDTPPLVQNFWVHPTTDGPLTVEMQLTQPTVQITDNRIRTHGQHGIRLDLSPMPQKKTEYPTPQHIASVATNFPTTPSILDASHCAHSPSPVRTSTRFLPHLFFTTACQMLSLPCP